MTLSAVTRPRPSVAAGGRNRTRAANTPRDSSALIRRFSSSAVALGFGELRVNASTRTFFSGGGAGVVVHQEATNFTARY